MDSRQLELLGYLNQASTNVRPQVAYLRFEAGSTLALADKFLKELVRRVGMWCPSEPACTDQCLILRFGYLYEKWTIAYSRRYQKETGRLADLQRRALV
jgi:hypothetical protein